MEERLSVPWYDFVLAALGLGACLYFVYRYDDIVNMFFANRQEAFYISLVIVPLTWEALRRTSGWSLTIIFSIFVVDRF